MLQFEGIFRTLERRHEYLGHLNIVKFIDLCTMMSYAII